MKNYEDAFFVNPENETVSWIYYNPNSNSGGQYVENICSFDEIISISSIPNVLNNFQAFFDAFEEICIQDLSDKGTEYFEPMDKKFNGNPDFTDCTKETMLGILERVNELMEQPVVSFPVVESEEQKVLYAILNALKINDIVLSYDNGVLVAKDSYDNEWKGKEFYDFLENEAFVPDGNGVLGIGDELLAKFHSFAKKYSELKPCPFCGGKITHYHTEHETLFARTFSFRCENCNTLFFIPLNASLLSNAKGTKLNKKIDGGTNA